jgi:hypothetical protein
LTILASLLMTLTKVCGEMKSALTTTHATLPFGGINVVFFGDQHQFPPVRNPSGALYCRTNKTDRAAVGHSIYEQFQTVVTLTEQMRMRDPRWMELLNRARDGDCDEEDITILNEMVLTDPRCSKPDFSCAPWNNAVLVTPRHSARVRWNDAAVHKHCQDSGNILYVCNAEDTVGSSNREPTMKERFQVAGMTETHTGKLPHRLALAVGMKAMVVLNIATEADLANGARGEITDIVLDPREPSLQITDGNETSLKYPPAMILFKPYHCTFQPLDNLNSGLIPIFPSEAKFNVGRNSEKRRVTRRQPAITAAYAFTDYRSQGQTIEHVIVDLGKPPGGGLTGFNAYVALSRSRGRDTVRLLREFDTQMFTQHPCDDLRVEDERLQLLTELTKLKFEKGMYHFSSTTIG